MGRRLLSAIAMAAALIMAACGGAPSPANEFTKADADEIRGILRDFAAAYNAKDLEKIGSFYAQTASLMPINRTTLRGLESVKSYYEGRVKFEGGADLALEPIAIEGQGSLAYVAAGFTMVFNPPDGSAQRHDRGKVLWILRKLGGHWKFEYQMMSSDLPAAAPVVPAAK